MILPGDKGRASVGLDTDTYHRVVHNFSSSWQKFLNSRIVITERQRRSLLGGSGGMPRQEIFTF